MNYNDPWAWVEEQRPAAPLSGASIQPSQATPAAVQQEQPGVLTSVVQPMVVGKAITKGTDVLEEAATPYIKEGITGISNAMGLSSAPLAQYGGQVAADDALMQGAGVLAPVAEAATIGAAAAPATAAIGAGAGAAEAGMLATLGPYAPLALGGIALAKMLKII